MFSEWKLKENISFLNSLAKLAKFLAKFAKNKQTTVLTIEIGCSYYFVHNVERRTYHNKSSKVYKYNKHLIKPLLGSRLVNDFLSKVENMKRKKFFLMKEIRGLVRHAKEEIGLESHNTT